MERYIDAKGITYRDTMDYERAYSTCPRLNIIVPNSLLCVKDPFLPRHSKYYARTYIQLEVDDERLLYIVHVRIGLDLVLKYKLEWTSVFNKDLWDTFELPYPITDSLKEKLKVPLAVNNL